ncbi:alpha/beta fold hydrolase [Nocardia sp. NPDC051030]|uniref:alpha/beta fold hydrolase n=1 Tax=Nocardia sp. NPDC051030 TaxID=3155162 RepID=UPI00343A5254
MRRQSSVSTLTRSAGIEPVVLDAGDMRLSALLALPGDAAPRATIVALHGAGMNSRYFDGQAHPGQSLLTLGRDLGFAVLAVDRPGYGQSATGAGYSLRAQSAAIHKALRDFENRYPAGAGLFLLAHSFGGKVALTIAADAIGGDLLGLDVSGCGRRFAASVDFPLDPAGERSRNWGPLRLYPPSTFRASGEAVTATPPRELAEALRWPAQFARLADRVTVPVRMTFAEFETWWRHDPEALDELRACLVNSPHVVIDRQPDAGHNISLGSTARSYHLRALAFAEECLARAELGGTLTRTGS